MRRLALIAMSLTLGHAVCAQDVTSARYIESTDVYGHGAVKNGEYAALEVTFSNGDASTARFENAIFEDTAPRLHDFDHDGSPEIVTVLSGFNGGARVQIFTSRDGTLMPYASNDPIGRRNRWLAIAGIADFDADGVDEIAYIDRPHLAKELVLLSVNPKNNGSAHLKEIRLKGVKLTNHALGAAHIEGGVRDCAGEIPVIVTANGDWSKIVETVFDGATFQSRIVKNYRSNQSLAPLLACP